MWDGKLFFIVIFAVIASALVGRMVAATYRNRVLALMGSPAAAGAPAPMPATQRHVPRGAAMADNRRGRRRAAILIVTVSLAFGMTVGWAELQLIYKADYGPIKLALWGLGRSWVVMPALGLFWRWPWWRIVLASATYMAVVGLLIFLRSDESQTLAATAIWILSSIAPALLAFALAASGPARATGPYLLPAFILLSAASVAGTDVLQALMENPTPQLKDLLDAVGAVPLVSLFALAPWLLLGWPVWRLGKAIARAYARHHFSEPLYLIGSFWLVMLLLDALAATHTAGGASMGLLLCWLWLPLGIRLGRGWLAPPAEPPNLLVLRVFRRDEAVQALFDSVIARWRSSGTVSLIAGTDLALQTLDPDELFAFLNGQLEARFIRSADDLQRQLAAIDTRPDPDGRFRVTDFYCLDSTWKLALDELVFSADVVLMDLRGLAANNLGCLHELAVLAGAGHLQRIVLLFDGHTDRDAAQAAIGTQSARFDWYDAGNLGRASAQAVVARLLGAA